MLNPDTFLQSLVITNKSHGYFTNWTKARAFQDVYKDELALLGVLSNSNSPKEELRRLLKTYPRINSLIPLLSSVRINNSERTLTVLDEATTEDIQYYFGEKNLTDELIESTIGFAEKSGLLKELVSIKNYSDYYFGVEVGSDSNARKNRSGTAMEDIAEPYIRDFANKYNGVYLTQKKFAAAAKEFGVETPSNQSNKKGDFMILVEGIPINIEVNFFDSGGSKQEIMNSYISRAEDLREAGWGFGLITDGLGWRSGRNQVEHGFSTIGNIMNLSMCNDGALEEMYKNIKSRKR